MLLEVCVDTLEAAIAAEQGGAHRLEVCGNLNKGGTTPSEKLIQEVKKYTELPIMMMIRPKGGNFVYTKDEILEMKKSINLGKKYGVQGFVFGMLKDDNSIDISQTKEINALCEGYEATFHRAFDECNNPIKALERLMEIGINRILTSGQKPTAEKGKYLIRQLVTLAGNKLIILPGSGVNSSNAKQIVDFTDAIEIHGSCKGPSGKTDAAEVAKILEVLK